jgi:hypothetical protein
MPDKEPTQRTTRGAEIPVPKRSAWDKVFRRAARPEDDKGPPPAPEAENNRDE